mmetsp:Transcript_57851/g.183452  ORF Transcript_57851/g.183452 Transcript_57851/m.183452 type:complete len:324 (+) Transcript_57851:454-1425(+)
MRRSMSSLNLSFCTRALRSSSSWILSTSSSGLFRLGGPSSGIERIGAVPQAADHCASGSPTNLAEALPTDHCAGLPTRGAALRSGPPSRPPYIRSMSSTAAGYWAAYHAHQRAVAEGQDPPPLPPATAAYIAERLDALDRGRATFLSRWDAYHEYERAVAADEDPPPLPLETAAYIAERLDTLDRGRATQGLAANQVYMAATYGVLNERGDGAEFTVRDIADRIDRGLCQTREWLNKMTSAGHIVRRGTRAARGEARYRATAFIRQAPGGAGPPDFIFKQDGGLAAAAHTWATDTVPLCSKCRKRAARKNTSRGGYYDKCGKC